MKIGKGSDNLVNTLTKRKSSDREAVTMNSLIEYNCPRRRALHVLPKRSRIRLITSGYQGAFSRFNK